jgi:hypothetical protein
VSLMFNNLISTVTVFDGDLLRNIKAVRDFSPLCDDLGETDADFQVGDAVAAKGEPVGGDLLTWPFHYGTAVAYPFIKDNWQHTRFSAGTEYGVWYGSLELETTMHESVYHWRRFVVNSFPKEKQVVGERRVFKALCQGILVSLLDKETVAPELLHPSDYSFSNSLGKYMRDQNQNGLLVKSARCSGINAAIFTEKILSNVRDHCFLSYFFSPANGGPVRIERVRGEDILVVQ